MNNSTFNLLNQTQQFWYANVMIDMILADGHIHPSEQKYLGLIFKLFAKNPKKLAQLKEKSQKSSPETIQPIKGISRKLSLLILQDCVDAAIADAEFHEKEKNLIYEIGKNLNCDSGEIEAAINRGMGQLGHIFAFAS